MTPMDPWPPSTKEPASSRSGKELRLSHALVDAIEALLAIGAAGPVLAPRRLRPGKAKEPLVAIDILDVYESHVSE